MRDESGVDEMGWGGKLLGADHLKVVFVLLRGGFITRQLEVIEGVSYWMSDF